MESNQSGRILRTGERLTSFMKLVLLMLNNCKISGYELFVYLHFIFIIITTTFILFLYRFSFQQCLYCVGGYSGSDRDLINGVRLILRPPQKGHDETKGSRNKIELWIKESEATQEGSATVRRIAKSFKVHGLGVAEDYPFKLHRHNASDPTSSKS